MTSSKKETTEPAFREISRMLGEETALRICELLDDEKPCITRARAEKIRAGVSAEAAAAIWFRFQGERIRLPSAAAAKKIRERRAREQRILRYRKAALKDATAAYLEGLRRESVVRAADRAAKRNNGKLFN